MNLFIQALGTDPFYYLSWVLIVAFSICFHEFCHAWTSLREGDDTAARMGHLSMNPLVQMGWTSLIMLALIGIAWGAVPVDVRRMRSRASAALVAAAGPAGNLLLSILTGAVAVILDRAGVGATAVTFFVWASQANGVLFLFNMLPIPMLDGWTVLSLFVPSIHRLDPQSMQTASLIGLVVVWTTPVGGLIWGGGSGIGVYFIRTWDTLAGAILG